MVVIFCDGSTTTKAAMASCSLIAFFDPHYRPTVQTTISLKQENDYSWLTECML